MPVGAASPMQFSMSGPPAAGGGALTAGYNNALQALQQSLNASNGLYTGAANQLGQQLQQNQGKVQQNLINSGLGNTSVAQTMQQAPLQTYNQGMLNVTNAQQGATSNAYTNLANAMAQGGGQISAYAMPFVQSQYAQQQGQQAANNSYKNNYQAAQQNPYMNAGMFMPPWPQQQ